jgi:tetratricopeptide (TPR) repeat protein
LLSGELCRDGGELLLLAELTDREQAVVWSGSFRQEVNDENQVERDLATLVANGVALELGEIVTPAHSTAVNARALELLRSGQHHRKQGKVEAAREAFEGALEYEPEYAEVLFELALITADSVDSVVGGIEEAWPIGEKALVLARSEIDRGVIDYKPHQVIAKILMTMANWDKGLTWRTAAEMNEAEIAARKAAASSVTEEGEQHLREAIRLNPSDIELRWQMVRILEMQGAEKRAEALEVLEHGRLTEPLDPRFIGYLANQLNNRGQYQKAMDEIERFRRDFGKMTPRLLWQQLEIQTKAGQIDDKLATCIETLRDEPELFARGSLRLGHMYWLVGHVRWLGMPAESEALYQAFSAIPTYDGDPTRKWLGTPNPGSLDENKEEKSEKLAEIERLSNEEILDRSVFEAAEYINAIWISGDLERTIELIESMRHRSLLPLWAQQAHEWLVGLATLYIEVGRPSAAIPVLEEAVELLEADVASGLRHPATLTTLAASYAMLGQDQAALDMLSMAVDYGAWGLEDDYDRIAQQENPEFWEWHSLRDDSRFHDLLDRMRDERARQQDSVKTLLAQNDINALLAPVIEQHTAMLEQRRQEQ